MKPSEAEEDNAFDGIKDVSSKSDDKLVEPEKHVQGVHHTITEVSHDPVVSDAQWVCKSPSDDSSTVSGWPSFNTKSSSNRYLLSAEEQATVAELNLQLKALEACQEFLAGNAGSDCDDDDTDDEDEDELVDSYDSEQSEEYKFFEKVFAEDGKLRRYYENNHKEGVFYCLVCGGIGKKVWKRFKDCVALLQHSTAILRTKRRRAHRAYAQVVCKVVGWDIDQLPAIVIKDLDNSLAGSRKLLVEPNKPAVSHIDDSNGEPVKVADDSDVLQECAGKSE